MYPAKSDPVKTGEYIAYLRKKREMTQFELAAALQVSHQAVSKWETGSALPDIDVLLAIANFFDVSLDNLIFGGNTHQLSDVRYLADEIERIEEEDAEPLADDQILYSETICSAIKTNSDIPLLLEAFGEMREEDIADCIQTLGITEPDILLKLFTRLRSGKIAQVIKTLHLPAMVPLAAERMSGFDIGDCRQTLGIDDMETMSAIARAMNDSRMQHPTVYVSKND